MTPISISVFHGIDQEEIVLEAAVNTESTSVSGVYLLLRLPEADSPAKSRVVVEPASCPVSVEIVRGGPATQALHGTLTVTAGASAVEVTGTVAAIGGVPAGIVGTTGTAIAFSAIAFSL